MRLLFCIIISIAMSVGAVRAQQLDQQPIVETELDKSEVVPGQYATLRVRVLVPTWLPRPVEFPSMETPNMRVRLPERSTNPTSRTIDGTEWSGVSRSYLISPMLAGRFDIPAQNIVVTYAIPGSSDVAQAILQTQPVRITGIVPQGAEGLAPFIAADSLELTQEVTQPTTVLQPGQSVKRTVTAQIVGASPIVLPQLMPEVRIDGIAVYPDEPSVSEVDDRSVLSGTRTETVTLMAEGGSAGHVSGIELRWFNLKSGAIEMATLDGFDISVEGPPASRPAPERSTLMLAAAGLAALVGLAVLALLIRWAWPRAASAYHLRRARRLASKAWAQSVMLKAIHRHDYPATLRAVDEWASRPPVTEAARLAPVHQALTGIGRSIYGQTKGRPRSSDWRAVSEAVRRALAAPVGNGVYLLPPLNPGTAPAVAQATHPADAPVSFGEA
ncbi:BatD family protein [Aurantimonas endophytica]|uniref:Oxygen tolerance protein BatD n=1 Tax=Aurantimonas endophytica TaxID=1522175 RepID=A0A7W6HI40_9HYPH|nr:BatD family protein [Aurantimonas endophytica]MBB4005631.1 hypothetical protein [Aurantimonas endophytica]MCO6406415.1 hypothetical protein [Aurantimonas endophytica]